LTTPASLHVLLLDSASARSRSAQIVPELLSLPRPERPKASWKDSNHPSMPIADFIFPAMAARLGLFRPSKMRVRPSTLVQRLQLPTMLLPDCSSPPCAGTASIRPPTAQPGRDFPPSREI